MKLALITPGGFDPGGRDNVIPALVALAAELATRHEVHVFAFGGPGGVSRHSLAGAEIHQLGDPSIVDPPRLIRGGRMLARLAWQLSREFARASTLTLAQARAPFQVVHAFWASEPGLLAGLLGGIARVPVVVSVGGGEASWLPEIHYGGAGSMLGRVVTRLSLGMAREITIGTDFARSFLSAPAAERVRIIPLGIDCREFDAAPDRPAGPPWRLLHVGSLNAVKDHSTLLAAFAEVVARLRHVTLDCVGEDTRGGEAQSRARSLGIDSRVRFLGFLPNSELVALYRGAHLHVVSSRYESQSVVVLEAAAAALPTVGTAVGLLPTLAPEAAVCVATGDPRALADAICALLTDEPKRIAMGRSARAFARAHDVAWTARAFETLYEGVATEGGQGEEG